MEWREHVNSFWRRALKDNPATLGLDTELVSEVQEEEESEKSEENDSDDSADDSEQQQSEDEEMMDNNEGKCSKDINLLSTPDKKQCSEQSHSRSKPTKKSRLQLVQEERSVEVQGLKFTLQKNAKGCHFADVACPRQKVEIGVMRQLIEDMIAKGFYTLEDEPD